MKNSYLAMIFCFYIFNIANGQSTSNLNSFATEESTIDWLELKPAIIVRSDKFFAAYGNLLGLSTNDNFILSKSDSDDLGFVHERYEQYFNNIKIEGAQYIFHSKEERVVSANGKIISGLNLSTSPSVSAEAAIKTAFNSVGSNKYAWQDSNQVNIWIYHQKQKIEDLYPKGKLVIVCIQREFSKSPNDFVLAWRLEIRTANPYDSRIVYVNAINNQVIKTEPLTLNCIPTTGQTTWHGSQPINTSYNSSQYILSEQCFNHGDIHAINYSISSTTDYFDSDNIWTTNNQSGISALKYARMTLDFYYNYFNRNGFDNAGSTIYLYNQDATTPNNAGWNNQNGVYLGNGGSPSDYDDFGTIDIIGHEITHAVTQHSAGLNYSNESGALNEAFSDIFGAGTERYFEGACCFDWLLGEDRMGGTLWTRSLSDPKNYGAHITNCVLNTPTLAIGQPNTYGGTYWYTGTCDNGGVHTNSGVLNYWFYLLSQGGSGTNDNGYSYTFNGIGFNDAILIAYRTLTVYLSPTSVYGDAKIGSLQSAVDRFGAGSTQYNTVLAAWCAVGLGTSCSGSGCTPPSTPSTISPGNSSYPGTNAGTLTPTFDWNAVAGATNYTLSISIYPFGSGNIIFSQCLGNPPYTLPTGYLTNNNYYRWDIQANVGCGTCVSGFAIDKYFNTVLGGGNQPNLLSQTGGAIMTGNIAQYNYTIGNNGTANAGSFSINFYACTTSSFTNPIWVGSDYVSQGLNVASTYSSQANIDFCSLGLTNGSYYLGYFIDYSNQVSENNENDNNNFYSSSSYPINCTTGGQPNLYLQAGGTGTTGNLANFNYTISNNGTGSAGSFLINFYACSTPVFTNPIWVGSEYVSQGLSIGASYSSQTNVDLCNSGLATGSYYLGIFVDYSNQVIESNEIDNNNFNNSLSFPINCGGGACTYSILPTTGHATFLFGGGSDWTYLTASNSSCTWTATSAVNWITILNSTGTGSAQIDYQVSTNPSQNPRVGTINIEGQVCTVFQDGQNCPVTVTPLADNISSISNNYSFNITLDGDCGYSVGSSDPSWLTILSVVGDTIVNYNVNANTGGSTRLGLITVDTALHYVYQSGTGSSPVADFYANDLIPVPFQTVYFYDLSVNSPTSWLWSITPASYSFQNGTTTNSQNPEIIFTSTGFYTITLQSQNAFGNDIETKTNYLDVENCSFSIDSISHTFNNLGGIGVVQISDMNGTGCGWIPVNYPSWVHILHPLSMTFGNDQVIYSVDSCTGGSRTGTITIVGYLHNLIQNCTITSTQDITSSNQVFIYPNPTMEVINIKGEGLSNGKYQIILANTVGQELKKESLNVSNNSLEIKLNLKELTTGIYFLSLSSEKEKQIVKVIKQ